MVCMKEQADYRLEDLVHGTPKMGSPNTRNYDQRIQSFDFGDTCRLPMKVRELRQFGWHECSFFSCMLDEAQRRLMLKWTLVIMIAFAVGLTAGGLILCSHFLVHWKLHLMQHWMEEGHNLYAFLLWFGYGMGSCLIAASLVTFVEPTAGGSGIPDVKAYLNGNLLPGILKARTWFCRVIGLIFVTSSGLFAGTEGPMAHVGAITAAGLALGRSSRMLCELRFFAGLQNHQAKLEFMSLGASIGVAAAFGAPIGGLLFSLEEASSFWTPQLTWRAFLGGCIASLVAKGAKTGFTTMPLMGFIEFPDHEIEWSLWELVPFLAIAICLGLLGALFCESVRRIQQLRSRVFRLGQKDRVRKKARLAEALVVTAITMTVTYALAWAVPCTKDDDASIGRRLASPYYTDQGMRLMASHCEDPATEASGVATVLLESREHAIKALFSRHFVHGSFEEAHLGVLTVVIFFLTLLAYGCSIPAGLFIPNIMCGACFGRLVGQLIQKLVEPSVHPGVYALMGATGMLAGFSRMTVSLGVIVLEITSDTRLLLPIMLVIMAAKLIGDIFTPSAYDIIIALKNIPILEQPDESRGWQEMAKHPVTLCGTKRRDMEVIHASSGLTSHDAMKMLSNTQHNAWPVLASPMHSRLLGLVTRQRLLTNLEEERTICGSPSKVPPPIVLQGMEMHKTLDLQHIMDVPTVVLHQTPLRTAYRTFRSLGLRHLCVVDDRHRLVSFITRTDLAEVAEELVRPNVMQMRDFSEALVRDDSQSDIDGSQTIDGFKADGEALPGSRVWRRQQRMMAEAAYASEGALTKQNSEPALPSSTSLEWGLEFLKDSQKQVKRGSERLSLTEDEAIHSVRKAKTVAM